MFVYAHGLNMKRFNEKRSMASLYIMQIMSAITWERGTLEKKSRTIILRANIPSPIRNGELAHNNYIADIHVLV